MPGTTPVITALVQGPDRPGIIATITGFIFSRGGNIIYLDQHTDTDEGMFFMRVQFSAADGDGPGRSNMEADFGEACRNLGMAWRLTYPESVPRAAIMVSRQGHCLSDLLYRWRSGGLRLELPLIVSNHEDQRSLAEYYGIPYFNFSLGDDDKEAGEAAVLDLLGEYKVDTVILARFMRLLSPRFVGAYRHAIINIHHSFLPAFAGADPYRQAFTRGVKLIGATSHYVTEELDQGPIIAQDVVQISHRDTVEDLKRKGQDLEKLVLARAVGLHLDNRIMVHQGKTIVFCD